MNSMFMIWFLLLIVAIGLAVLLLSREFRTKVGGFLLSAAALGIIVVILYVTQWSQSSVALY